MAIKIYTGKNFVRNRFLHIEGALYYRKNTEKEAGYTDKAGHRRIRVNRKLFNRATLVFYYYFNRFPKGYAKHINGCVADDHLRNLRFTKEANEWLK